MKRGARRKTEQRKWRAGWKLARRASEEALSLWRCGASPSAAPLQSQRRRSSRGTLAGRSVICGCASGKAAPGRGCRRKRSSTAASTRMASVMAKPAEAGARVGTGGARGLRNGNHESGLGHGAASTEDSAGRRQHQRGHFAGKRTVWGWCRLPGWASGARRGRHSRVSAACACIRAASAPFMALRPTGQPAETCLCRRSCAARRQREHMPSWGPSLSGRLR